MKKIILVVALITVLGGATGCSSKKAEEKKSEDGVAHMDPSKGTKKTNESGEEVFEVEMEDGQVVEMQENPDK